MTNIIVVTPWRVRVHDQKKNPFASPKENYTSARLIIHFRSDSKLLPITSLTLTILFLCKHIILMVYSVYNLFKLYEIFSMYERNRTNYHR